jgi:hypothetical protein
MGTMKRHGVSRTSVVRGRFWASAALCLLACGGKLNEGGEPSDPQAEAGASSAPSGGSSSPGSGSGDTALGACRLGFVLEAEPARDCAWLARGRCYETKLAACNCICPVDRQDSICSSGFDDGPNGKTEVKCY